MKINESFIFDIENDGYTKCEINKKGRNEITLNLNRVGIHKLKKTIEKLTEEWKMNEIIVSVGKCIVLSTEKEERGKMKVCNDDQELIFKVYKKWESTWIKMIPDNTLLGLCISKTRMSLG